MVKFITFTNNWCRSIHEACTIAGKYAHNFLAFAFMIGLFFIIHIMGKTQYT